ncbi:MULTISPECIES: YhjD/YihY/BrkB family envelope integrity protein [unclassified Streptomyces]|uniref:YhjD/YihY/BrkB family envelope integrity protein n=1 Tax=unclassified Streptomyces TaxID=2593676 RepID=UPI000B879EDA|nr:MULTISPECIES: YhjD/YihY/BrkB family envelope integrity protein [unclassified Streptomyces]MYS19429.1 ribonuclease BN [Streptomyces sp. SID4948]
MWKQGAEIELMHRSMGFAALGFVTLMPLLVVVAAATPWQHGAGFAQWVVDGMGLGPHPASAVRGLFTAPRRVLSTTGAWSLASLAFFGLSFVACVETGYRKIWDLPASPWHSEWRRAVWLAVLTGYLFCEAQSATVMGSGEFRSVIRIALTVVFGIAFFAWGQRFLLTGSVDLRSAMPGAVLTMAGLGGLRIFSARIFSPMITSNAVTYGPVGTVLMVVTWLIGVGFVVFGAALLGRHIVVQREVRAGGQVPGPRQAEVPSGTEPSVRGARWRADGAGGGIEPSPSRVGRWGARYGRYNGDDSRLSDRWQR